MSCFNGDKCKDMRDDFITAVLGGKIITAGQIAVDGVKEMAAGAVEAIKPAPDKPKRRPRK